MSTIREEIGAKLTALVSPIVPLYYSEAQSTDYPYAVYEQNVSPTYTKDGIGLLTSACTVRIYSPDFDEADRLSDEVQAAIATEMNDSQFYTRCTLVSKDCLEDIWIIELDYTIKQKA